MESNCPFCNAVLPALNTAPTAEKLPCPRCGELVPAARWRVETAIAVGEPKMAPPAVKADVPGIRRTALIVLSVMAIMAIIGLSYALWTVKLRQSRHPRPVLDPITIRKPIELSGLGHLTKGNDIIAGIHLSECLADKKVGKPLLDEPRPAGLDWVLKQLPRISGLPLEEIDHVLVSAAFDTPQLNLVVKTRRAYALDKIVEGIRPTRSTEHEKFPLYEFSLKPWGEGMLWCVEAKTLLCVVRLEPPKLEHLRALSATSRTLDEALAPPLRNVIEKRLPRQHYLWAVGGLEKLDQLKEMLPMVPAGKAELAALKGVKTFAIGVEPTEGLTLTGEFNLRSPQATANLKSFLEGARIEGATQKLAATQPHQEQWLTWQVRGDVAAMREWLNRGKTKN